MKDYGSPSREAGFTKAASLFKTNGGKLIIETGCSWYSAQGNSTLHLAELAMEVGGEFHSIDINAEHVEAARKMVSHISCANVHIGDSLDYLSGCLDQATVDLLYLDAFDHDEQHPNILAIYNLAELGACIGKMAKHSVILMDDWGWGRGGSYMKCSLSRELLLYRGWTLVQEDYQLLFAR